jgi:hypothetical protein
MVRFFPICIDYQGDNLWAKVVEQHLSPSTFHVTFQDKRSNDFPEEIILDTKKGKIALAKNSSKVDDEILKSVIIQIEEYLRDHPLSSDFRL